MSKTRGVFGFLLAMALGFSAVGADKNFMADISKLLATEDESRGKLDSHISDYLKDMQNINAATKEIGMLETTLSRAETKIADDRETMIENHQRIEFLNSFISGLEKLDTPRVGAPGLLLDLAHRDVLSSVETGNDSKLWLFEIYLSIAIRDIMEPSENFAEFVKSYMAYSTLRDPRSPAQFLRTRSYLGAKPSLKSETEKPKDPPAKIDFK